MNISWFKSRALVLAIICFVWPLTWPVGLWLGGFILLTVRFDAAISFCENQSFILSIKAYEERSKRHSRDQERSHLYRCRTGIGLTGTTLSWFGIVLSVIPE